MAPSGFGAYMQDCSVLFVVQIVSGFKVNILYLKYAHYCILQCFIIPPVLSLFLIQCSARKRWLLESVVELGLHWQNSL